MPDQPEPARTFSPPSSHSPYNVESGFDGGVLPPIVFVSRGKIKNAPDDPAAEPGFGPQYRTSIVGGRLMVRDSGGSLRIVVPPEKLVDVADPCVSWDGNRILFSGVSSRDSSWRIYEVGANGSGLRQLTHSNRNISLSQFGAAADYFQRYDDFDPCYLPDGRIVFASTRYPSMASFYEVPTSNLFVMNADGSQLHRITTERNGGEEPSIDPVTGRIVYARWWVNRDRPSNHERHGVTRDEKFALTNDIANLWQAIAIRSDGAGLQLYAGFPRTRAGLQTYKPALLDNGILLSTFTLNASMNPGIGGTGIRWFKKGADIEHHILGIPSGGEIDPAPAPYATDPVQLTGTQILCSYSRNGKDFGIFECSLDGTGLVKVVDLDGTHELEPQLLQSHPVPPILHEEFPYPTSELPPTEDPRTYFKNDTFRFDCMNIFTNGGVDEPMPDAPRIATGAKIRFFMNVQRQNARYPDPSIFLKEGEVTLAGGVHQHDIPADVPLFEQVIDAHGRVLETSSGRFAHVAGMNFDRMGSGTKCVGCHVGHSMLTVPINGATAEWFNVAPSATVTANSSLLLSNGTPCLPRHLVDRQAQSGGDTVIWVGSKGGSMAHLSWDIPIEARELVLYGIPQNEQEGTTIVVHDCEILLYYHSQLVGQTISTGEIRVDGTRVQFPPTDIDSVTIAIRKFTGTFQYRKAAGLAEVETIARISRLNYHLNREG